MESGLNSSEEWLWNTLFKSGGSKLSLPTFHFSCHICSQQGVTELPFIVPLSKISKTFLSDTAELERGGAGHGPDFWRYWTVMYHADFSWSCGYSGLLIVTARTAVTFSIQVKTRSPKLLPSGWNISQKFNQSLWNYFFISHEMHFFTLIIFLQKAIKWCMKGREVTKLKGLRNNHLNYNDQLHCKQNPADSEIPYYSFYKLLLLVYLLPT